jgi:hypothetical protein
MSAASTPSLRTTSTTSYSPARPAITCTTRGSLARAIFSMRSSSDLGGGVERIERIVRQVQRTAAARLDLVRHLDAAGAGARDGARGGGGVEQGRSEISSE